MNQIIHNYDDTALNLIIETNQILQYKDEDRKAEGRIVTAVNPKEGLTVRLFRKRGENVYQSIDGRHLWRSAV
ncbi:MAG: hypothetical protein HDR18_11370 [Lachnospiraceae bacterium]|nr:hypothetical protein [Lachnospiraceae bacterium]